MKRLSGRLLRQTGPFLGVALIALWATTAGAQTVDEVIAQNIKADGGREMLLGVRTLERKGTVTYVGTFGRRKGTIEEICFPWKKARRLMDFGIFKMNDGWDGQVAWSGGRSSIKKVDGQEATPIKVVSELNPFVMIGEVGTKAEKLEDGTFGKVSCYVIQLSPKDRPVAKFYIDKNSNHICHMTLRRVVPRQGEVDVAIDSFEYQDFSGIKLPTRCHLTVGDSMKLEMTFRETKVNGKIDESIFQMPNGGVGFF